MNFEMTGRCRTHGFEPAASICHRCGAEYCGNCLVHPLGDSRPLCKDCAISAAGVRTHTVLPAMSKREIRNRAKMFGSPPRPVIAVEQPIEPPFVELEPEPEFVSCAASIDPAPGVAPPIDWSRPFG